MLKSVKINLAFKIILGLIIIAIPSLFVMRSYVLSVVEQQVSHNAHAAMDVMTANEAKDIEKHFRKLEKIGWQSVEFIKSKINRMPTDQELTDFNGKYKEIDGALRTDVSQFASKDISAVFLSSRAVLTDYTKQLIINTEGVFDDYARGVKGVVFNMYLITSGQMIRIYEKDWSLEIEADHDFTKDIFYKVATPENNPLRQAVWTAPYYDSIWKRWMTSLITPVYLEDTFVGIVGHDVILDEIYNDIVKKKFFSSGHGFIFDHQKNIIIHPHHLDKLLTKGKMGTKLSSSDIGDTMLSTMIDQVVTEGIPTEHKQVSISYESIHYHCMKLDFLDWYYGIMIPNQEILGILPHLRRQLSISVSITAGLIFIFVVVLIWRSAISPIVKISHATSEIGSGNFDYRVRFNSGDEVGTLARSVNSMAQNLGEITKKLADTERSLVEYADAMTTFNARISTNGKVLWVNATAASAAGMPRENICGRLFKDAYWWNYDPDIQSRLADSIRQAAQGTLIQYNVKVRTISEGFIFISFNLQPVFDVNGKVEYLVAEGRNISELVNTQESLKESESRYRTLIETTNTGFVVVEGETGIVKEANVVYAQLAGYGSPEKVIGRSVIDWTAPHDIERNSIEILKCLEQGYVRNLEIDYVHKDGKVVPVEINATTLTTKEGLVIQTLCRDISERKRFERDLRKTRSYLSNVINSMPSILIGIDKDGKIEDINSAAETMSGMSSLKAAGHSMDEIFPFVGNYFDEIKQTILKNNVLEKHRIPVVINGVDKRFDLTAYPLISQELEGAVIRIDDVTEKVTLEEVMIQSEKMLSVGGLAAGMAHEINNPLSGIMQNTQVMKGRLGDEIPANSEIAEKLGLDLSVMSRYLEERGVNRCIDNIHRAGSRAVKIVDNMLSFARKSESATEAHDLSSLLEQTVELAENDYDLKKRYDFRRIHIVREYQQDVPKVPCEASKIQQVFLNLLKNAAYAMNDARTLEPRIVLRIIKETAYVRIEIEDNGPGMPEAVRKRALEPFYTTKSVGDGTGLGLSVSYFIIVENHKGEMLIDSEEGKRTTFIIRLPLI